VPSVDRGEIHRDAYINLHLLATGFAQEFEADFRPFGLTQGQFTVLWVLAESSQRNGLAVGQIADGLLTRRGDVTRLVDRLVEAGLVVRFPGVEDRRTVLVRITPAGRKLYRRVKTAVRSRHDQQWSSLDLQELATLDHLLQKARRNRRPVDRAHAPHE